MSSEPQQSESTVRRLWRLGLKARQQELAGPLDHVIDIAGRLRETPFAIADPQFLSDCKKIRDAAIAARRELDAAIRAPEPGKNLSETHRATLRHDLRNRLNVVLGYTEDWLDHANEQMGAEIRDDLVLVLQAARSCLRDLDLILAPETGQEADEASLIRNVFASANRDTGRQPRENGSILIVDDDPLNRCVLRRRLERIGHTVHEADGPSATFAAVKDNSFDLILLDVILRGERSPERNGFDVLVHLKADPKTRDLPIILLSALNEPELTARGIELGAEDYLSRPIDPVLLQARIDICLEKVRLREREKQYLIEIERERQRADELLHVLLPPRVIATLKETNEIPPRRYDGVAVIFADIAGFTPYCDHHPPEEVITKLARVVDLWELAANRHSVQKVKTIGDAFMGACGLFEPVANPVRACVECGLEMIMQTSRLVPEWSLKVGVHFGDVVGGKVGRQQYLFDLWGDTVNTAARMESHGIPQTVTISQAAWEQIAQFAEGSRSEIPVKGKGTQAVHRFIRWHKPR